MGGRCRAARRRLRLLQCKKFIRSKETAMPPCFARGFVAWLLPPALLLQACASTVPPVPVTSLDPANLAVVHRALEDQPVTLVLASGEVVREAEDVVVGAESTSWRPPAGGPYLSGLQGDSPAPVSSREGIRVGHPGLGSLILVEGLCPLIGILIARGSTERVVYEAPSRQRLIAGCGPPTGRG
jgi:hypothetical protein